MRFGYIYVVLLFAWLIISLIRKTDAMRQGARQEKESPRNEPVGDPKLISALQLFGLKPGATLPEITSAYRRRILNIHPDRSTLDRETATEQTQRLNAAYAFLKSRYGH